MATATTSDTEYPALRSTPGAGPWGGREHLLRFDTYADQVRAASVDRGASSARRVSDAEWAGTATFEEAAELALEGWSDIRPEVDAFAGDVLAEYRFNVGRRPRKRFDVVGEEVDLGRYIAGAPDCMVNRVKVRSAMHTRTVVVLVDQWISASIPTAHIRNRGAAVVALCDVLAEFGYSLEVWTETTLKAADDNLTVLTCIKSGTAPWDINTAMFALAHPSAIRRILFGTQEQAPMAIRRKFGTAQGGYGGTGGPQGLQYGDHVEANVKLRGGTSLPDFSSVESAAAWIGRTIEELGIAST